MTPLSLKTLLRCLARTYLVSAAYNTRGLQNVGFIYAIDPGLAAIHGQGAALRAARGRYLRHYNCHPCWTPFLLGAFLRMETDIAAGKIDASLFMRVKDVSANTLSAIGDSVFSGSILAAWALSATLFAVLGEPKLALALTLALFTTLQCFKAATFFVGLRRGLVGLQLMARWDLINWGDIVKMLNAFLLILLLGILLQPRLHPWDWLLALLAMPLAAGLAGRVHFPRIVLALITLAAAALLQPGGSGF
jgi:PTS system mannose-specific IID component